MPGAVLRSCLVIYLVLELIDTPLHLNLQPYSDVADAWSSANQSGTAVGEHVLAE